MITVQVKKNQITVPKAKLEPMTSGSQNVYPIQFLFSQEWTYLEKIAVFATDMTKDGPKETIYNMLLDDNGRCMIPWEVLLNHTNHVYVGVYGAMNGNVVLPTIWADIGAIVLGVYTGLDAEPPTPDIHQQILGKIGEIKGIVDEFMGSGLKIFKDKVLFNKKDFESQFPAAFVMTRSSITTNQESMSISWPFLSEVVHVRDKLYFDPDPEEMLVPIDQVEKDKAPDDNTDNSEENQNGRPALFVTDMLGTTYAFPYDEFGYFTEMILVNDPSVKWKDIVGRPYLGDVTRTRVVTGTLYATRWDENGHQNMMIPSISGDYRFQLIFPIPTKDSEDLYYEHDIRAVDQEEGKLGFYTTNVPTENCNVDVYILNAENLGWKPDVDADCCCIDYDFLTGLTETELDPKKVEVTVNTVDDLQGGEEEQKLPMSMGGVKTIVGDIDKLLGRI